MSKFIKVKKISKFFIWLSIIAVSISVGGSFLLSNKIGADTLPKDYRYDTATNTFIMGNISNSEILNFDYTGGTGGKPENLGGLPRVENDGIKELLGDQCGTIQKNGSACFALTIINAWPGATVLPKANPTWAFLQEAENKTAADIDINTIIKRAKSDYAMCALANWPDTKILDLKSGATSINIISNEFFSYIGDEGIKNPGPYVEIVNNSTKGYPNLATIHFPGTYSEASENSVWSKAVSFLFGSVIVPWQRNFSVDLSDQATYLDQQNKIYTAYAKANASNGSNTSSDGVLKLEGPSKIIIGNSGTSVTDAKFDVKIDTVKFPKPANGYITDVYFKPASQVERNAYIKIRNTSDAFSFTWSDVANGQYLTTNDGPWVADPTMVADGTARIYNDKSYPQKYFVHIISRKADGSTQAEISQNFETVNENYITNNVGGSEESNNGAQGLQLSIDKDFTSPGKSVVVKITATDNIDPKKMNKVVLWLCEGDAEYTIPGDSSNCKFIKNSWENFTYSGTSVVLPPFTWDTSGTAPGIYSLMAKGHTVTASGTDFIDGTKVARTINVTDAEEPGPGNITPGAGNRIPMGDGFKAGSSIGTVEKLADKIIEYILYAISAFAVIAIIIGGIFYITSGGDEKKAEKGKKTLIYAVVGIMIAASGWFIYGIILDLVKQILG